MKRHACLLLGSFVLGLSLAASNLLAEDCPSKEDRWPFTIDFGNNTGKIFFDSEFMLERNCKELTSRGFFGARGGLLGVEAQLIEADAEIRVSDRKKMAFNSGIAVLGFLVDSQRHEDLIELRWKDSAKFPVNLSDSQVIMAGPIPVKVSYGVNGEVGADYGLSVNFLKADLDASPYTNTQVFAEAAADVGFAHAKASGEVVLLKDKLKTKTSLTMDQVNFNQVEVQAIADNDMDALDGQVDIRAGANLGAFKRTYEKELLRWEGYARQDRVYDVARTISLF